MSNSEKKFKKIKINEVRVGNQNGIELFQFFIKIKELKKIYYIDQFEGDDRLSLGLDGVQRKRKKVKIKKLADHLLGINGFCPISIWLNDRDKTVKVERDAYKKEGKVRISFTKPNRGSVGDGHLRTLGFIEALALDSEGVMDDFDVNIIMTQLDRSMERRAFMDINLNFFESLFFAQYPLFRPPFCQTGNRIGNG